MDNKDSTKINYIYVEKLCTVNYTQENYTLFSQLK